MPVGLVAAICTGNVLLFTRQIDPVLGSLLFVLEVGLLSWIIYMLRSSRYRWRTPSFNLVFFSILGIALVCAFAGIEPLASAKDEALSWAQAFGDRLDDSRTSGISGSSSDEPKEVDSNIKIKDPARLGVPEDLAQPYIEVVVTSNDYTEPGTVYCVEVVSDEHSFGKKTVRWDRIPGGLLGEHECITLRFGLSRGDRVFQSVIAEQKLPVSKRTGLKPTDLLRVIITKG